MIINQGSLPQIVDSVNRSFQKGLESIDAGILGSGLVVRSSRAHGTGLSEVLAEMPDVDQYATFRADGDISDSGSVQYGYEKALFIENFSKEMVVTKLMRDGGKYDMIGRLIATFSNVVPNKIDLDLTNRLTYAYSTTFTDNKGRTIDNTTGDGLAIASAVHTLTGSATTYSTIITANPQFSKAALEVAMNQAYQETYTNKGERAQMNFDVIFTGLHKQTVNQVKELLNATANVDSANAGTFNVFQGSQRHVILPRLDVSSSTGGTDTTKSKIWGIASTPNSQFIYQELNAPYVKTPIDGNNGEDFSSENWKFLYGASYGHAVLGARWIRLSNGLGI